VCVRAVSPLWAAVVTFGKRRACMCAEIHLCMGGGDGQLGVSLSDDEAFVVPSCRLFGIVWHVWNHFASSRIFV
jgi:hypothetical protein